MAAENAEEPKHDDGPGQNAEGDGETTDTDAGGIMAVDVEGLSRPEHDDREEVGAGDEGDDQSQGQDARILLQASWEHGEFGTFDFPDAQDNESCSAKEKGNEDMGRGPFVLFEELAVRHGSCSGSAGANLISSPLQSAEEEDHPRDTQEATNKIDLTDDLPS